MDQILSSGRFLFAVGLAFLGLQQLAAADFVPGVFDAPAWVPARAVLACLSGGCLAAVALAGAAMKDARRPALGAATVLGLFLLFFHLPNPRPILGDGVVRTRAFETLSLTAATLALAGALLPARVLFGIAMGVFGLQHFLYAGFIATLVPSWIPAPSFWVYLSGVGMIAAGLAIASGALSRAGGTWLGIMFLSWVVLLHGPRVARQLGNAAEWNSLAVALAMGGASWIFARLPAPRAHVE